MRQNMLITIGLPFYNAGEYLAQAINSIINQTYIDWELILVNDGSTDNSVEIALHFSQQDSRIKFINDNQNKGLVYRLNQIVELANGEYIARMDADDVMHSHRLQKQIKHMLKYPDTDVIGTSAYIIDEKGNIIGKKNVRTDNKGLQKKYFLFKYFFIHPSILVKRKWFVKNKYISKYERMEDFELWYRSSDSSVYCNLPEPLMYYRVQNKGFLKKYLKTELNKRFFFGELYKNKEISTLIFCTLIVFSNTKCFFYKIVNYFNIAHLINFTDLKNIKIYSS